MQENISRAEHGEERSFEEWEKSLKEREKILDEMEDLITHAKENNDEIEALQVQMKNFKPGQDLEGIDLQLYEAMLDRVEYLHENNSELFQRMEILKEAHKKAM
ncbi:Uncharacterised protein [Wolinella succinogenes]|nr:Uncharacterised protein [Wolinella succinogenes]